MYFAKINIFEKSQFLLTYWTECISFCVQECFFVESTLNSILQNWFQTVHFPFETLPEVIRDFAIAHFSIIKLRDENINFTNTYDDYESEICKCTFFNASCFKFRNNFKKASSSKHNGLILLLTLLSNAALISRHTSSLCK